jgi:hypothetical protein
MIKIINIVFISIALQYNCFCQIIDSIDFKMYGRVLDDTFKTAVKFPIVTISSSDGNIYEIKGDSSGNYIFQKKISTKANKMEIRVSGKKQLAAKDKITIDTTKKDVKINRDYYLKPGLICIDTWILPNVYFEKNSLSYYPYVDEDLTLDTLLSIDSIFSDWVKLYLNTKTFQDAKIEIVSYAGYDENDSISMIRADFIYKKLISLGISSDKLIISNYNKDVFQFYKYRNGCHPYYIIEKQPLLIDKNYIDSLTDFKEKKAAEKLRRIVTFNWKWK